MSEKRIEDRLVDLISQCLFDLLNDLGGKPQRVVPPQPLASHGECIAAFIGFGNDDLRGSLTFVASRQVFARLHPLPPTESSRDLVDWASEIANQVMGRFRNRMLAHHVNIPYSVPQSGLAEQLRLAPSFEPSRTPITLTLDGKVLEIWVDLELKPNFHYVEGPADNKGPALEEGSMVLF